ASLSGDCGDTGGNGDECGYENREVEGAVEKTIDHAKQIFMSADEFQQLWKSYEEKLQKSMKLNLALMEANLNRKARVAFNWQIAFKIMMIGLGLAWNIFVGGLM